MITLMLVMLAQAPEAEPAAAAEPAAPPPAAAAKPAEKPAAAPPPSDAPPPLSNDQITRQIEKMKRMTPEEVTKAATELGKRMPPIDPEAIKKQAMPQMAVDPVIPEVKDYSTLPEADQVKYSAREFFTQLIAGDARNITNNCAFPFQLEERRLQTPDELFQEWLRNLRAKRTDLLTLYDIEVLSPADMEKKYGKPPARLQSLPWRGAKTYVAVANLSGHAAVAVFRHTGVSWAVVGYAD